MLEALGAGHVDLYGDSYGTFVAQAFAARHGDKLTSARARQRLPGVTEAIPSTRDRIPAMFTAFDLVCERTAPCKAKGGSSSERIKALLDSLRQSPVRVSTTDPDGQSVAVSADPVSLLSLLLSAATDWTVYRELDAAAAVVARG